MYDCIRGVVWKVVTFLPPGLLKYTNVNDFSLIEGSYAQNLYSECCRVGFGVVIQSAGNLDVVSRFNARFIVARECGSGIAWLKLGYPEISTKVYGILVQNCRFELYFKYLVSPSSVSYEET